MKAELNGTHYYFIRLPYTHSEARMYCGDKYPKGDLMEIDSSEKIKIARQLVFENHNGKYIYVFLNCLFCSASVPDRKCINFPSKLIFLPNC